MHAYSCKHFTRSLTAAAVAAALYNFRPIFLVVGWDGGSSPGDVMYHFIMLKGRKWPGMSRKKKEEEEEESGCQDSADGGYSRSILSNFYVDDTGKS